MRSAARVILAALALFLAGVPALAQDYLVGENDVLEVKVYEHADLTSTVRVSGEGTIIFPLVGEVAVAGLSVREVEARIQDLLADGYIVNPLVTVFVKEFRSRKITILGEVARSGLYELAGDSSLLEIISKAGDLTDDAGERAIIKRVKPRRPGSDPTDEDSTKTITVDLKKLIREGDSSLNIPVWDGDSIYIPRAGYFFVTGEVTKPGSYKYQEGTTVLKAITMAGGFTEKAAKGRIKIIRRVDGADSERKVGMEEWLFPEDVLEVPESFF